MVHRRRWFVGSAASGLILLVASCSQSERPVAKTQAADNAPVSASPSERSPQPVAVTKLAAVEVGSTTPVHQHGRYYLAGQPSESDLAAWKKKGVRTVITLRTPGEIDWDEKAAVEAHGMTFVSIPFRGADTLGDAQIEEALAALKDDANGPILLHCGTSHRVGAIWYAHRIRHDGVTPANALAEAKTVGLRNTSLTDVVDAYCERVAQSQ